MAESLPQQNEPTHIRATHPYAFRSGEWARLLTTVESRSRDCWLVEFEDGVTDWWVKDDLSHGYEFRTSLGTPVELRPHRFTLRYWRVLRRSFSWRDCLRIMWHGGTLHIEECE